MKDVGQLFSSYHSVILTFSSPKMQPQIVWHGVAVQPVHTTLIQLSWSTAILILTIIIVITRNYAYSKFGFHEIIDITVLL